MTGSKIPRFIQRLLGYFHATKEENQTSTMPTPSQQASAPVTVKPSSFPQTEQASVFVSEFEQRAFYCTMGDLRSMMWMFWHFINQVQEECEALSEENWKTVVMHHGDQMDACFKTEISRSSPTIHCYKPKDLALRSAMFWLDRAAIYGSALAKEIQSTYPFCDYVDHTFEVRVNNIPQGQTGVTGSDMKNLGLFSFNEIGCFETSSQYAGIVECSKSADFVDPDDSGFGGGREYHFHFFNEFYERLTSIFDISFSARYRNDTICEMEEKCKIAWLEKQKIRDAFWEDQKDNPEMERYHQLIAPTVFE